MEGSRDIDNLLQNLDSMGLADLTKKQGSMSGTVYLPDKNQDYKPSCALT
ncbi:hypothetical protein M514_05762 [Trichuris suis]|uniref:Uncharacterized protein n=1 Tax=Trichuris suis TaxID=68888 RepID=A0A085M7T5_9BILA|nr:hypothetical protein M513_05762 [Trichuris suis]KFD66364.1 hypothetical protein M514_05762 [Trichuris suis]